MTCKNAHVHELRSRGCEWNPGARHLWDTKVCRVLTCQNVVAKKRTAFDWEPRLECTRTALYKGGKELYLFREVGLYAIGIADSGTPKALHAACYMLS